MRKSLFVLVVALFGLMASPAALHAADEDSYKAEEVTWGQVFNPNLEFEKEELIIDTEGGRLYQMTVEMALSQSQQRKGLMERKSLDDNAGMLFWFGRPEKAAFWMRNTLIPLDMLFIRQDGTIDHIHSNARPLDETHITGPNPVWAILEINGGLADKWGIHEGDKIIHPLFRNVLAE